MSRQIAEFAYDLHAGLASSRIPDFDEIQLVGMAATLSIHIKGLGEIDYELLRRVSDHFLSIQSVALKNVVELLENVDFVKVVRNGKHIEKIIPNIPVFDDVYERLGQYAASECSLNSFEQATLEILGQLRDAPRNRDSLFNQLGIEKPLFDRCLQIGQHGGILSPHQARGKTIIISPYYFADNLDGLADVAAVAGANNIASALKKVKGNQGWPLSLVQSRQEIGGTKLSTTELDLIHRLSSEGVMKPPTVRFGEKSESFIFTPRPGNTRLNAANREIYERAMALISAVRKGQLLADQYRIRYPISILNHLRNLGYIGSNSEADKQYLNLAIMRVGYLNEASPGRWRFHLHRTPENEAALNLAIDMLRAGDVANMEINEEARIALTRDDTYIQSLVSAAELKRREKQIVDTEAAHEFEQLVLKLES